MPVEHASRPSELFERYTLLLPKIPQIGANSRHTASVAYSACLFTTLLSVQVDRDELRQARLFHGDAVEHIRSFHRLPVVGDHQELRLAGQLPQDAQKPVDVRVVERRIHLVEDAEGARAEIEDGEEQ